LYETLRCRHSEQTERPASNFESEERKEQTYASEEKLLEYFVRIIKNDILEETEELIKFRSEATSLLDVHFLKQPCSA